MPRSTRPTLYRETEDGFVDEIELPTRFALCPSCEGRGATSHHVECDGGGFTSSEWAEQDEDFREDYLAGRYDRPCDACNGLRVIEVVDESRLDRRTRKAWRDQCRDDADHDAIRRAEIAMGA
jgi:DnaJ-class molecular chaperone